MPSKNLPDLTPEARQLLVEHCDNQLKNLTRLINDSASQTYAAITLLEEARQIAERRAFLLAE